MTMSYLLFERDQEQVIPWDKVATYNRITVREQILEMAIATRIRRLFIACLITLELIDKTE